MFDTLLGFGLSIGGFLSGVLVGLKVLAPRTKTKVDDVVLRVAEKVIPVIIAAEKAERLKRSTRTPRRR